MAVQLRVSLPDQPGALARVTQVIAVAGADVLSVTVLESESGRAVDEFRLRWPDQKDEQILVDRVAACEGVIVLGCRRTPWLGDGRPDLDLLIALLTAPDRGIETLVDMAPVALDADWAQLRAPTRRLSVLYATTEATHDGAAPDAMPVRAMSGVDGDCAWVWLPVPELHSVLVIGRDAGPPFLRSEVVAAERVLEVSLRVVADALRRQPVEDGRTELTAHLARAPTGR